MHFAQNAVLQMEHWIGEFELNVQTLFDAYFHFNGRVGGTAFALVVHYEFFLFRDFVVVSVDHHVDVVPKEGETT